MNTLGQDVSLCSLPPFTDDSCEAYVDVPDNEELLDFLTHLADEDALDFFDAPGSNSTMPTTESASAKQETYLWDHQHTAPQSTTGAEGNHTSMRLNETVLLNATEAAPQQVQQLEEIQVPHVAVDDQDEGRRLSQMTSLEVVPLGELYSGSHDNSMNDDTPPENVMPVLMDTDGTIHARLSVHAPSSTSNRQATACVPDISPDNGGSAAAQVRQETKKQRQARLLREKNRRNQKKFRERQRAQVQELSDKIEATKAALHQRLSNRRRLQSENAALLTSLLDSSCSDSRPSDIPAPGSGSAVESAPCSMPYVFSEPTLLTPGGASSHDIHRTCAAAMKSGDQDVIQHSSRQQGPRTFGAGNEHQPGIPAPISSFEQCAALSYRLLEKHLIPRRLWKSNPQGYIAQAYNLYVNEVTEMTGVSSAKTCWFLQSHFEIEPGAPVSYSAGFHSPECSLSAALVYAAMTLQSVFLVAEHEYLESVSSPSNPSEKHTSQMLDSCSHMVYSMQADHAWWPQGKQPDPHLLQRLRVRVGVNSSWPLADAVRKVLEPMVRECKATLPPHRWKRVGLMVMHVLHANLRTYKQQTSPEDDDEVAEAAQCMEPPVDTSEGVTWMELNQALLALQQQILVTTCAALWEGPQMQSKGASMESVERRMLMHVGSVGVCTHAASMADPLRLRGLMEARMLHKQHNMAQRIHSRLYKFMSLNSHQRDSLAARWHAWCRRRRNMDQPFLAAALDLQNLLEASTPLVECASGVAAAVAGPADSHSSRASESAPCMHAQSHVHHLLGSIGLLEPTKGTYEKDFSALSLESKNVHALEENGTRNASESVTDVNMNTVTPPQPSSIYGSFMHQRSGIKEGASVQECMAACARLGALLDMAGGAPQILGQCGARVGAAQATVQALLHVHHTDDLMLVELLAPPWELSGVQHAKLLASPMVLGLSALEMLQMCQIAAGETRREELFGTGSDADWL